MSIEKPNTEAVLAGLKDFQRQTVDYVFTQLYGPVPVNRFLIADEVGLGKTLIAKGVVAKAVEHLWVDPNRRIDIVYICANRDIAAQNVARLNITNEKDIALATRLTLLPLTETSLSNRLNFVSFTPGTSFELRSKGGVMKERALLYRMLKEPWAFGARLGPSKLLQADAGEGSWDSWLRWIYSDKDVTLNEKLVELFIQGLSKTSLREEFDSIASEYSRLRTDAGSELRSRRNKMLGDLRRTLARSCLTSLEPDIIILDEFQRFKTLLDEENEVAQLAQDLFNFEGAKVLLLSATPYKMYTMDHETEQENHYADFLKTVKFLLPPEQSLGAFQNDLARYRKALYEVGTHGAAHLNESKIAIERTLRQVMVRTERLSITLDRDGMIADKPLENCRLEAQDLQGFVLSDGVASALGVSDTIEYWKSSPFPLNLMDNDAYAIKRKLSEFQDKAMPKGLAEAIEGSKAALLPAETIRKYNKLDPQNVKLRALVHNTATAGWNLLWVPPSYPYYTPTTGPYKNPNGFTKALVFSSWKVVPKAIATLVSYEAERLALGENKDRIRYGDFARKKKALLVFAKSEGELKGMNFLPLIYPCIALASKIDPAQIAGELSTGTTPTQTQVEAAVRERVKILLAPIIKGLPREAEGKARGDTSWYAASLAFLDRQYAEGPARAWQSLDDEPSEAGRQGSWASMLHSRKEDAESPFAEHIEKFKNYFLHKERPGVVPSDLEDVITKVALASPAVAALRSLLRLATPVERESQGGQIMSAAAHVAMGFRSLFNLPDSLSVIRTLRAGDDERYWEAVLDYAVEGNLQAVLDEYVHILRESLGQAGKPASQSVARIADEMAGAASLRTVPLRYHDIQVANRTLLLKQESIRCRFALRYGDGDPEQDGDEVTRADQVRASFNSPFRPFVLASTSVGQEGLDFHHYCHSIYHWNLPSNPVDLEQREGRIHRYKGHVIRRNIARDSRWPDILGRLRELGDPWEIMFSLARERRAVGMNDLVPYWIYEPVADSSAQASYKIERYAPVLPLSRDVAHFARLKNTLAAYRMVFGQPRQEDLISFLRAHLERDLSQEELLMYRIDLSPRPNPDGRTGNARAEMPGYLY